MTENQLNNKYNDEQEIDIMEMISKLWKKRSMIIKWCIAGAIFGLVIGFSIPKTYKAGVTLVPEVQQRTASGVSAIASMMGVSLNNSVDAIDAEMYPDVVHSTDFIINLFDVPVTFTRRDSVITAPLLVYMKEYQKKPWWRSTINLPFKALRWCIDLVTPDKENIQFAGEETLNSRNLPKKERRVVKYFVENIKVNVDKKSHKTVMVLQMQDPLVVATVMDAVTENLKTYMTQYRTSKARQDVKNLEAICQHRKEDYYKAQQAYAKYIDANKNVILQSANAERERLQQEMNLAYQVYSQVATNLEGARIQAEQAKPVFVIVENVKIPIRKAAPSKAKLLMIFTLLAGCCAAGWVLFGEKYWKELKNVL